MIRFLMTYLPLLIAAICAILLGIWMAGLRKEKRKEFLGNMGRLIVATLLSFSIALFSVSLSTGWQEEQERIATVARLFSIYDEVMKNLKRIDQLMYDYVRGEVKDIEFYLPRKRHVNLFVGCESYYRCSLVLQAKLGDMLHVVECLTIRIDRSGGKVDEKLLPELLGLKKDLTRCEKILEEVGREMHESTWEKQLQISERKGIVGY